MCCKNAEDLFAVRTKNYGDECTYDYNCKEGTCKGDLFTLVSGGSMKCATENKVGEYCLTRDKLAINKDNEEYQTVIDEQNKTYSTYGNDNFCLSKLCGLSYFEEIGEEYIPIYKCCSDMTKDGSRDVCTGLRSKWTTCAKTQIIKKKLENNESQIHIDKSDLQICKIDRSFDIEKENNILVKYIGYKNDGNINTDEKTIKEYIEDDNLEIINRNYIYSSIEEDLQFYCTPEILD